MTKISNDMPVADLAALVCQHLANHRIEAVLTGGAVVTIYSENEYQSNDLDFISTAREKLIDGAMKSLGFARKVGSIDVPEMAKRRKRRPTRKAAATPATMSADPKRTGATRPAGLLMPSSCPMRDELATSAFARP